MVEVLHLPHPKLLGLLRGGEHFSAHSRHCTRSGSDPVSNLQHTQPASDATQQGPLFGGTSLKHVAYSAGSRCRLSLALVRAASALLHRDRGAHPDTQCAVCRRTTATARSDAVKTACDHKDGQLSRTPYALQHAPGALPDAQQALRHHAYVFVMKIE